MMKQYIYSYLNALLLVFLLAKPITTSEIISAIKNLHPKKSPGHDLTTNNIVKHFTKKSILLLPTTYFELNVKIILFPSCMENHYGPKTKQTKTPNFFLSSNRKIVTYLR